MFASLSSNVLLLEARALLCTSTTALHSQGLVLLLKQLVTAASFFVSAQRCMQACTVLCHDAIMTLCFQMLGPEDGSCAG
jgi:hypothetical protein